MAEKTLITVAAAAAAEFTEKKSRFIGQIAPAASEAAAQAFLERIREQHKSANHHCYAWQIGQDDQFQRSADAGEPAGTAGRPILEAVKRAGLHNTVLVVSRYFGGVLLGAGGLARAYGKGAQLAIEAARLVEKVPAVRIALHFGYGLLGKVETFCNQPGLVLEEKLYAEQACFICLVAEAEQEGLRQALADLSNGALRWQDLGEKLFIDRPIPARP